jgi:predicted phosphodiesterase
VRYLIISDIHGNVQALDAVLADAATVGYDAALCLGDLVGYGADPSAVIARVADLAPVAMVRGNHDKVCAGLEPPTLFNDVARRAAEWTHETLSADDLKTLTELAKGPMRVTDSIEICHGSPFDEDHYVFDEADAARSIEAASARLCLFGHTHLPAVFSTSSDPAAHTSGLEPEELALPRTGPALINVGSVGQPRDNDPRAAYGVLDLEKQTIRIRRTPYDIHAAQNAIINAGLPVWLALRLERGQ